jgi:hypothetical protein
VQKSDRHDFREPALSIMSSRNAHPFIGLMRQIQHCAGAIGDAVLQLADAVDMLLVIGGPGETDIFRAMCFGPSTLAMAAAVVRTMGAPSGRS